MKKTLLDFYLNWVNNYLTTEKYAEVHNMSIDHTYKVLEIGRIIWKNKYG